MITLNGYDFDYYVDFNTQGIDNYGYVDFYKNDDMIIRVYVDDFDINTEYDDSPSSFNPNTGNIGYSSYSYDTVSDIRVYTEFIDSDENTYTKEQFIENNPEVNDIDKIVKEAERYTKNSFKDWWEDQ